MPEGLAVNPAWRKDAGYDILLNILTAQSASRKRHRYFDPEDTRVKKKPSLQQKTYDLVKQRILDEYYKPYSFIDEAELVAELGYSRTPVREALLKLSQAKFVELVPKKGYKVIPVTVDDISEIYKVRMLIEPYILCEYGPEISKEELRKTYDEILSQEKDEEERRFQAAFMENDEPHKMLYEHCHNRILKDVLSGLYDTCTRRKLVTGLLRASSGEDFVGENRRQHLEIVSLMMEDRYEEAAEVLRRHLDEIRTAICNYWRENE